MNRVAVAVIQSNRNRSDYSITSPRGEADRGPNEFGSLESICEAIMQLTVELTGPTYKTTTEPDMAEFRRLVLELPDEYWIEGNGQVQIRILGKETEDLLLVSPNKEFGIALKIFSDEFDWLSLHDPSRLAEITTVSDDWLTSVGLFLPPQDAWLAIDEFCRSGERSPAVKWIKSTEMPPESNW